MKPELWGPLGVIVGGLIAGVITIVSEKIKKKASPTEMAKATGEIWEQINRRMDEERRELAAQVSQCKTALQTANDYSKARDIATWDHLEARDDYDETSDRVMAMLERIAKRVMTDEERADYEIDAALRLRHREALDNADRTLRQTLFR